MSVHWFAGKNLALLLGAILMGLIPMRVAGQPQYCGSFPYPSVVENSAWQYGQFVKDPPTGPPPVDLTDDYNDNGPVHAALVHSRLQLGGTLGNGKIVVWRRKYFRTFSLDGSCSSSEAAHPDSRPYYHDHFCSGHAVLPDGRILIAGQPYGMGREGVDLAPPPPGESWASILDPKTSEVTSLPNMPGLPRFYPSVIVRPDGKCLIVGGTYWEADDNPFNHRVDGSEIERNLEWLEFDPATSSYTVAKTLDSYFYAWLHYIPSSPTRTGGLLWSGQEDGVDVAGNFLSRLYGHISGSGIGPELRSDRWTVPLVPHREGGAAVLLSIPPTGTSDMPLVILGGGKSCDPTRTAQRFDLTNPSFPDGSAWETVGAMLGNDADPEGRRAHPNAVLLPDGKVAVMGGAVHLGCVDAACGDCFGCEGECVSTELLHKEGMTFNPVTWAFAPADTLNHPRDYHSFGLLMPDGRVFFAGNEDEYGDTYETYYPPYFFESDGAGGSRFISQRPVIVHTTPAETLKYGQSVVVGFDDMSFDPATDKVVLMRPGSATHAWDSDQRLLDLEVAYWHPDWDVTVKAPIDSTFAARGYYMLFVVDRTPGGQMLPTVAKWMYLDRAPGGGPSCPYLFVGGDTLFTIENNILANSEFSTETPPYVIDHYLINGSCSPVREHYQLDLRELELDRTSLDQARLTAVDHAPEVGVAVAPDGRLVKYGAAIAPNSVTDQDGIDHLAELDSRAGGKFQGDAGDDLLLTFRAPRGGPIQLPIPPGVPADLLLVVDYKEPVCQDPPCPASIIVQVPDEGGWRDVEVIHPRALWEDYVVDLAGEITGITDSLQIRLVWTQRHDIDYAAFLLPSRADVETTALRLVEATHSSSASVLDELMLADSVYADILPAEKISLAFDDGPPIPEGSVRDFFFTTLGYYLLGDAPQGSGSFPEQHALESRGEPARSGPNPLHAGEATRIAYSVKSAGRVSLAIYDVTGRRIKQLMDGVVPGGTHVVAWNGRDDYNRQVAPGIYFSVVATGGSKQSTKLVVVE